MASINVRVYDKIKEKAEAALNEMGLNISSAITMYLAKIGNEGRIPFEIETIDAKRNREEQARRFNAYAEAIGKLQKPNE